MTIELSVFTVNQDVWDAATDEEKIDIIEGGKFSIAMLQEGEKSNHPKLAPDYLPLPHTTCGAPTLNWRAKAGHPLNRYKSPWATRASRRHKFTWAAHRIL